MGAVFVTYFIIGLGLLSFLGWMGRDHLVARIASIIALVMALWMLKDVFLPGVGPSMMAPGGTHGRMQKAMERGGLAGMLIAGVLVGICTVPCSGAMYLSDHRGAPRLGRRRHRATPCSRSTTSRSSCRCSSCSASCRNKRVLGQLGRWNRANSPWIKAGLALAVIAMSFGLMVSM